MRRLEIPTWPIHFGEQVGICSGLFQSDEVLPHGQGDLVQGDDTNLMTMGKRSCLIECSDHMIVQSPHCTCGGIDDEHPDDDAAEKKVAKIPAIDCGIDGNCLSDSLTGEFDYILGWLEVTVR